MIEPLRRFGPPAADVIGPMPYPALQSMLDATAPAGLQNYWKSTFINSLSESAIDVLVAQAAAMRSPLAALHLHHMHGAVSRIGTNATAFTNRGAQFVLNIVGTWPDPADGDANIYWVRATHDAISPHASTVPYVNFMGEEGAERVRAAYSPATYARLVALKRQFDPHNVFRLSQNIRPE